MNEKELSKDEAVPETESREEHETPPPPKDWSMPEPQFQQTSGSLPQGFPKHVEGSDVLEIPAITAPAASDQQATEASAEPLLEITESAPAPIVRDSPVVPTPTPAAVNIEPQPDLSEQISEDVSVERPATQAAASGGSRTMLTVLGVIAMLVVLAVFLAFVYLYFIAAPGATNNF